MRPTTPDMISQSMVNMTEADLRLMTLPGLHETVWDEREFLGWRDVHHSTKGVSRVLGRRRTTRVDGSRCAIADAGGAKRHLCSLPHTAASTPGEPVYRTQDR